MAAGERGIEWCSSSKVTALDPEPRSPRWRTAGRCPIPFSRHPRAPAPQVVADSALAEDGWIAVDHRTFATKFENVYAVGDVTSAPVPRVGAIAEGEARTLAEVLIHQIKGGEVPAPYRGTATCYIESGAIAARFDANFLSGRRRPAPSRRPPRRSSRRRSSSAPRVAGAGSASTDSCAMEGWKARQRRSMRCATLDTD